MDSKITKIEKTDIYWDDGKCEGEGFTFYFDSGFAYDIWETEDFATNCRSHRPCGEDNRPIEVWEKEIDTAEIAALKLFAKIGMKSAEFYNQALADYGVIEEIPVTEKKSVTICAPMLSITNSSKSGQETPTASLKENGLKLA